MQQVRGGQAKVQRDVSMRAVRETGRGGRLRVGAAVFLILRPTGAP